MRKPLIALVAAIGFCCSLQHAAAQVDTRQKEDYELVEKIGSRRAYETFLQEYKTGPYADIIRERLNKLRALDGRADEEFNRRLIRPQTK